MLVAVQVRRFARLEELGRDRAALKAYRASLAVNPHQVEAEEGVARLRQAAEGTPV